MIYILTRLGGRNVMTRTATDGVVCYNYGNTIFPKNTSGTFPNALLCIAKMWEGKEER